ncbi:hypothetical protein PHET_00368 [Paragonimus heterotremus]|uniref:Uncharacterized protein n=1 Tax=Paragonimus heterotremus TaxID=100268 RepID=A0A8J4T546_9TREM|nr:hypothetical protein PHET_00368 [Paragonimus heterotremus]
MKQSTYTVAMLVLATTAGILTLISIILIIAALSWQGVVVYIPRYQNAMAATCVNQVPRREGFFHICYTRQTNDTAVNRIGISCKQRELGVNKSSSGTAAMAYTELVEWRQMTIAAVIMGLLFALVGLILICVFFWRWYRATDYKNSHFYQRLATGTILMSSGLLYQLGTLFLHIYYMREKTTQTTNLPFAFSRWAEYLQVATDISYSHSYHMLSTSTYFVETAGILIICCSIISSYYYEITTSSDTMMSAFNYKVSLPRYVTDDLDYDDVANEQDGTAEKKLPDSYYQRH